MKKQNKPLFPRNLVGFADKLNFNFFATGSIIIFEIFFVMFQFEQAQRKLMTTQLFFRDKRNTKV